MRDIFPEYYRPSHDTFAKIWQDAIFVFDANVLLDIYRVSPQSSKDFLRLLEKLEDRVWIPYQFAMEYHRHKTSLQASPPDEYADVRKLVSDIRNQLQDRLNKLTKRTRLPTDNWQHRIDLVLNKLVKEINLAEDEHSKWLREENLQDKIAELFQNKVGKPYSDEKLKEVFELGNIRYKNKLPPGYEDSKKPETERQYGDLIGWFQIVDYATQSKRPIIFITNDQKEDWFSKQNGKSSGPRPELLREMREKAGVACYIYSTSKFIDDANEFLHSQVPKATIEEFNSIAEMKTQSSLATIDMINTTLVENGAIATIAPVSRTVYETMSIQPFRPVDAAYESLKMQHERELARTISTMDEAGKLAVSLQAIKEAEASRLARVASVMDEASKLASSLQGVQAAERELARTISIIDEASRPAIKAVNSTFNAMEDLAKYNRVIQPIADELPNSSESATEFIQATNTLKAAKELDEQDRLNEPSTEETE